MTNFSDIKQEECVVREIPKGVKLGKSRTIILQSVINEIKEHGRSSMNREVCGVLIGELCWDKEAYLLIDARIEGKYADHQSGSVTFTSETWDFIHQELSDKHPDKKIVGWYHTHPGFGIFLSNMDFFIHENFFGLKWQPAYVYDPQAETDGFFFWDENNNMAQGKISIIPDVAPVENVAENKPKEKISVVITENDEQRDNKQRLTYAFFTITFMLVALLSGLTIFFLYKHNKELEQNLKNESSQKVEWQREFKLHYELQIENDRKDREADSQKYKAQVQKLQNQIAQQSATIAQLSKQLNALKRTQHDNQKAVIELNRRLQEAQKRAKELEKQLQMLRRKNTVAVTPTPPSKASPQPPVVVPPKAEKKQQKPAIQPPPTPKEDSWSDSKVWPWNWF